MRLPDIDGLEVSRVVRADPALRHAKIIAVSAAVFPADVAAALASGCHVFLQKPCLPDALVDRDRAAARAGRDVAVMPIGGWDRPDLNPES